MSLNSTLTTINQIAEIYLEAKNYPFNSDNQAFDLLYNQLPEAIRNDFNLDVCYNVEGSSGKGKFTEIPWVRIFSNKIAPTAQRGIYIVFLFTSDMRGVYLSLNQGYSYFGDKYGAKEGRENVKRVVRYFQSKENLIPENIKKEIDLKATGNLGKGYMAAHLAGYYYEISNLPSESMLYKNLASLLSIYSRIEKEIGNSSIEKFYNDVVEYQKHLLFNESRYSEEVEKKLKSVEFNVVYGGLPKKKGKAINDIKGVKRYPRDPKVSANALRLAEYKCENGSDHDSFIRKSNKKNYTEPHHLIPVAAYKDFEYSLDIEENICSLCSNCHNCIHYGLNNEKKIILTKLYDERREMLEKVGLHVNLEQLMSYYKIRS